jgi:ribose 5-phosphate isomerase B
MSTPLPVMRVVIGTDHAGFALSRVVGRFLVDETGADVEYLGATSTDPVDYPPICIETAERVASGRADWGIVLGGSGQGEAISANKVDGIRAALCPTPRYAELAREHNDANVLALGGRFLTEEDAVAVIRRWVDTDFAGGRHAPRIAQIREYEQSRRPLAR